MIDAGASDHPTGLDLEGDIAAPPSWTITIALVAVVAVALLAGTLAFTDGSGPVAADPATDVAAAVTTVPPETAPPTTEPPDTVPPTTEPPQTVPPDTAPPETVPPETLPPTTAPPAPPETVPPTTPPPTIPPTSAAPTPVLSGWTPSTSGEGAFRAELPSPPVTNTAPVRTTSGNLVRTEQTADGPDGSIVSVTSIATSTGGREVADFLASVADQARRDLGGRLTLGAPENRAGVPARAFRIENGGVIRALLLYGNGRLYTVSMYRAGGPTPAADAAFDRVIASFAIV